MRTILNKARHLILAITLLITWKLTPEHIKIEFIYILTNGEKLNTPEKFYIYATKRNSI